MPLLVKTHQEIMTVVTQIQADWSAAKGYDLVVEVDNDNAVDEATQQNPYLKVQIKDASADQMDLGVDPNTQQRGQILFSVCVRCGKGTLVAKEMLDMISKYFAMVDLETVRCHTFESVGHKEIKSWWYQNGIINYWYIWRKSE